MEIHKGQGHLLDPHHERETAQMIRRAIRNKWPVRQDVKQLVIDRMAEIVRDSEQERNKIAAASVIVSADNVNARRETAPVNNAKINIAINSYKVYSGFSPDDV